MATAIQHDQATAGRDEQETIRLLQEEIARLEEELHLRDELALAAGPSPRGDEAPGVGEAASRRIDELTSELSERDETIALLWEQVNRFEQAEAAGRAEWEQLHTWVEELERRVEVGPDPGADRDAERRRAEQLAREWEAERRDWSAQRRRLEAEIAGLRAHRGDAAGGDPATLARAEAAEEVAARLRAANTELEAACAELRGQVRQLTDELERARREHEVELASARSEAARAALRPPDGASPDDRVRALRQHLLDLHEREAEGRRNEHLAGRISRLWRRTGPRR